MSVYTDPSAADNRRSLNNTACTVANWRATSGSPPAAPTLVSPSNNSSTSDTTPYFDWSAVSGATAYLLQVDDSSSFNSPEISTTTGNSDYTASSPLATGTYYWRVQASNSYGSGSWSPVWSFSLGSAPSVPTNLQASDGTYTNEVLVTWNSSSTATRYEVYRATTSTGSRSSDWYTGCHLFR